MQRQSRLFMDKGRPEATVVLNWNGKPEGEFRFIAEAYHLAAKRLLAALRENPYFGLDGIPIEDFGAYPVLFLYRHALELYMKAVVLAGAPMLSLRRMPPIDRDKLLQNHSLDSIMQQLESVSAAYEWRWDLETHRFRSLADVRRTVAELHEIDKQSQAFRYPIDREGNALLPSHFRFDLFEFCETLDELLAAFDGAAIGADEEFRAIRDESDLLCG